MRKQLLFIAITLLAVGCNNQPQKAESEAIVYEPGTRRMERAGDLSQIQTQADYYRYIDTYWDKFDFDADSLVVAYDTIDLCEAMASYVMFIEPQRADSLMRALMKRAERSRPVLQFFSTITEMVLHDPNSPLRNDEYYIPVLETLAESPLLDEYERMIPAYDLEICKLNRINHIANDFEYTVYNGRKATMHSIDSDYLIVMLNNPGCPMCREITEQIEASPMLNELQELGRLKILAIYPDTDIEAWRDYQPNMPKRWISGYDADLVISRERLYNLRAIPALYLLDSEKRVMVKDGTDVGHIEYMIAQNEALR